MNKANKHGRKVGYGLAGIAIGFIIYILLQSNIPEIINAKANIDDFDVSQPDNYLEDEEYELGELFEYGSYHITPSMLSEYVKTEVVRYGKTNPMFYLERESEQRVDETDNSPNSDVDRAEIVGQQNAIKSAQDYLRTIPFSKSGLIEQLELEGFSNEDSVYAVNNINVDWMEQAAKSAENYLRVIGLSHQGLIDQLKFDGFTDEQARHGANSAYNSNQSGGVSLIRDELLTGFNTETKRFETVDVSDVSKEFRSAGIPVDKEYYKSSSSYGIRIDPFEKVEAIHTGLDIAASGIEGANIYSVLPGEVVESVSTSGSYGNYVVLRHKGFRTMYAHMSDKPIHEVGDWVGQGELLGYVGNTGRSTGPHLHFEIIVNDVSIDPEEFLDPIERND